MKMGKKRVRKKPLYPMIHIQNPKDKDSYPYNEPHLQLNLWTLV